MSSQPLLDAIESAGEEELAQLERETAERVEKILSEAKQTAESRREAAYQEAYRPAATKRARRLHEARMEALKITAGARDQIAEKVLNRLEARLQSLRDQPEYHDLFRGLVKEAVQTLGQKEMANNNATPAARPRLNVDGRDQPLAQKLVQEFPVEMEVVPDLTTWGGVQLQSGDGRITVANTLEARLDQLKPHLGKFID